MQKDNLDAYSAIHSDLGSSFSFATSCTLKVNLAKHSYKVHSLSSGKVAATPILKSVPSQFWPFIL